MAQYSSQFDSNPSGSARFSSPSCLSTECGLDKLIVLRFGVHDHGFQPPSECAICYEAFRDNEEVKAMPCASTSACPSYYHGTCIARWLIKDPSCPLCRRSFPSLDPTPDACVPLIFGRGPMIDPPPISNPLRASPQERFVSARDLLHRYRNNYPEVGISSGRQPASRTWHPEDADAQLQQERRSRMGSQTAPRYQVGNSSSRCPIRVSDDSDDRSLRGLSFLERPSHPKPRIATSVSSGSLQPIRPLSELFASSGSSRHRSTRAV